MPFSNLSYLYYLIIFYRWVAYLISSDKEKTRFLIEKCIHEREIGITSKGSLMLMSMDFSFNEYIE